MNRTCTESSWTNMFDKKKPTVFGCFVPSFGSFHSDEQLQRVKPFIYIS